MSQDITLVVRLSVVTTEQYMGRQDGRAWTLLVEVSLSIEKLSSLREGWRRIKPGFCFSVVSLSVV